MRPNLRCGTKQKARIERTVQTFKLRPSAGFDYLQNRGGDASANRWHRNPSGSPPRDGNIVTETASRSKLPAAR